MPFLQPVTLTGSLVTLAPMHHDDHDGLVAAASDGRLWELWYTSVPTPEGMRADIEAKLAKQRAGSMLPLTTRRTGTGEVIGSTTYCNVDAAHRRVEVGYTWNAASTQRTGTNADSKLLLLGHAFDELDCIAVEFRTHFHNRQSRAAIERLGAKLDGILRSHQKLRDGSLRDTAVYSVTAAEWPAVKSGLQHRLQRHAGRR